MPIYEYCCPHCEIKFDLLRPFPKADVPARCPDCGGEDTKRAISVFAAMSKSSDGSQKSVAGGGGCGNCGGGRRCSVGHCGNCSHH